MSAYVKQIYKTMRHKSSISSYYTIHLFSKRFLKRSAYGKTFRTLLLTWRRLCILHFGGYLRTVRAKGCRECGSDRQHFFTSRPKIHPILSSFRACSLLTTPQLCRTGWRQTSFLGFSRAAARCHRKLDVHHSFSVLFDNCQPAYGIVCKT